MKRLTPKVWKQKIRPLKLSKVLHFIKLKKKSHFVRGREPWIRLLAKNRIQNRRLKESKKDRDTFKPLWIFEIKFRLAIYYNRLPGRNRKLREGYIIYKVALYRNFLDCLNVIWLKFDHINSAWNFWMNFTGISCVKFYTVI